jgi:hypothetical protein
MIIAYVPILFALVGLLMYALCANPKLQEVGRIVFAMAFLVTMASFAHNIFRIGS